MSPLHETCWAAHEAPAAMLALARRLGLDPRVEARGGVTRIDGHGAYDDEVEWSARRLGLECEPVTLRHDAIVDRVGELAPALVHLRHGDAPSLLALLGAGRRGRVRVLAPDGAVRSVGTREIRDALGAEHAAAIGDRIDVMLDTVGSHGPARRVAREAMLAANLEALPLDVGWLLRPAPDAPLHRRLARAGLHWRLLALVGAHALQYALLVAAWILVGRGALQGGVEPAWLLAWTLVLLTSACVRTLGRWWEARLAIDLGMELKQRLLLGALRLDPQRLRREGAGRSLSRVLESEAIGGPVVASALLAIGAAVELVVAAWVLVQGAGGWAHALALGAWTLLGGLMARRYLAVARTAARARLEMTHATVEQIVGHRTRLVQQPRARWHDAEDHELERYHQLGARADRWQARLVVLVSRGFWVVALAVLAPTVAALGAETDVVALSIGLGGVLLATRALHGLSAAATMLATATLAWEQAAPLLDAAASKPETDDGMITPPAAPREAPTIDAESLEFRYESRGRPVLRGTGLTIHRGDRILLQGASGSGKSTLAGLLTGTLAPQGGLLLLRGLDRPTWGTEGWHRHATHVPQFHDNHVLTGTLAFNLLMGRRWPPTDADLLRARDVCHELGLAPLLEQMPAGLMQVVGEQGWQLSHGERSRLFVARALLQGAELMVLDESLAALDSANLQRVAQCVLRRASTVVVVAHP